MTLKSLMISSALSAMLLAPGAVLARDLTVAIQNNLTGLDPTNVRCNTDVTVDGLQFRLLSLNPQRYTDLDVASTQFRNRIAYRCFGLDARAANAVDPLRSDWGSRCVS